jgi:hypothetical protein
MRSVLRLALAVGLGTAVAMTAVNVAHAMGSDDPYEDLQVGVSYTVYEPANTAGLKLAHTGSQYACPAGTEQNMIAVYGKSRTTPMEIVEGRPICSDPVGTGKALGTVSVLGAKAYVTVFCDLSNAKQSKNCSRNDMAKYGGALSVRLPAYGKLRSTDVIIQTYGTKPLSFAALLKVARSMRPVAAPSVIGGTATCTQTDFSDAIAAGLPKGQVLVSVDKFQCDSGWAYVFATLGDGKGHDIGVTYVFEAEGQFWIPQDRSKVCGTEVSGHPDQRPDDAQVPAGIWSNGCNTN